MSICKNCNHKNSDEMLFCIDCGSMLENTFSNQSALKKAQSEVINFIKDTKGIKKSSTPPLF